ncbi:hypothetical protein OSC04_22885, partial [Enterobacter hormaechei]|uniref:hypothetical protein n=1 Tax=Enterobacter hormaechei TaxID=158836 RepID=UPI00287634A5
TAGSLQLCHWPKNPNQCEIFPMDHCTIFCTVISGEQHTPACHAPVNPSRVAQNNALKQAVKALNTDNKVRPQPEITLLFIVSSSFIKIHYLLTIPGFAAFTRGNTKG